MTSIITNREPYILPDNLPTMPETKDEELSIETSGGKSSMKTRLYHLMGKCEEGTGAHTEGTSEGKSEGKSKGKVTEVLVRLRPPPHSDGTQGSIAWTIVQDSTREYLGIFTVASRPPVEGRVLEVPGSMNWRDESKKGDNWVTDANPEATARRAILFKTGLGSEKSLKEGWSSVKLLKSGQNFCVDSGTSNTMKSFGWYGATLNEPLKLDGSNLPEKPRMGSTHVSSNPNAKGTTQSAVVIPLVQLDEALSVFTENGFKIDAPLSVLATTVPSMLEAGTFDKWFTDAGLSIDDAKSAKSTLTSLEGSKFPLLV